MIERPPYWLEKLQVQVTVAAALAAAYFLVWPVVRPGDPMGPMALLAAGTARCIGLLAAAACVLAGACAILSISARPEGTMLAVLLGLGGLSLRSGSMRSILWLRQGDLSTLYWQMALEVLMLGAIVLAAVVVAAGARKVAGVLAGKWAWRDLLVALSDEQKLAYLRLAGSDDGAKQGGGFLGGGFARMVVEHLGMAADRREGRRMPAGDVLTRLALCFLVSAGITVAGVWLLARSFDRGQTLFALLAGSFAGTLIAYQAFPTCSSVAAWAAPLAAAVGFYVLGAVGAGGGEGAWMKVDPHYYALPIDWATAGLGGAMLGYWSSLRMHEAKFWEHCEQQEQGA